MIHLPQEVTEAVPTLGHRDRQFRGIFAGVIPITICVIFFIGGTYFVLDRWYSGRLEACQSALYVYPGSVILSRLDTPVTQPFGIIKTEMEMATVDDTPTVQQWYSTTWGRYVRQQVQDRDRTEPLSIPPRGWEIEPNPDGNGSLIHLTGYCP